MVTTIKGVARNVRWEKEYVEERGGLFSPNRSGPLREVPHLTVRVEQPGGDGHSVRYTTVVASASSIEELPDFITDGDEVEITGEVSEGKLEAHALTNLTTGMTVRLSKSPRQSMLSLGRMGRLLGWVVLAGVLWLVWSFEMGAPAGLAVLFSVVSLVVIAGAVRLSGSLVRLIVRVSPRLATGFSRFVRGVLALFLGLVRRAWSTVVVLTRNLRPFVVRLVDWLEELIEQWSTTESPLVIEEADEAGRDRYIVLRNAGEEQIDLSDAIITDEANNRFQFAEGFSIGPNETKRFDVHDSFTPRTDAVFTLTTTDGEEFTISSE